MKKVLLTTLLLLSAPVSAYEQIRTSDGVSCRSSNETRSELTTKGYTTDNGSTGASISITIKIGSMPDKLDCKRFANLEVERLKLELETLRNQLKEQNTWE